MLDGPDISVVGPLVVRGTLVVRAAAGARVQLGALTVANRGWSWEPLAEGEEATEEERIRWARGGARRGTGGGWGGVAGEEGSDQRGLSG